MAVFDREMVMLAPEPESQAVFARVPDLQVLVQIDPRKLSEVRHFFIEVSASMLPKVSEIVKVANETKYLRALFIREDVDAKLLPQILQRAELRLMRNMLVHGATDWVTPERVIHAWQMGSENELIATAAVFGDHLYVLTCALERLEVPFDSIPALKDLPTELRSHFEIDEVGSFLYWPERDVYIDIEVIRYVTDEKWRNKCDLETLTYDQNFGKAIASQRKKHNLKQSDIEGLTDRQLRRIESGDARPSAATLRALARAHTLSFDDYLEELGNMLRTVANQH